MNDFWTRKREELQQKGELPKPHVPVTQSNGPWWAYPEQTATQEPNVPQQPAQSHTGPRPRPSEGSCPHCQSGNYMKPSSSMAARCFDCGYTDGRQLNELNLPGIASPDAATLKVKQIQQGGHFGSSVQEINQNNAVLEQSAQGRTKLN